MADRSAGSSGLTYRDLFADSFVTRLTMLGAAAFGFLATFLLLDHQIRTLANVMLPLLAIVPAYLFLMSLNMWWAARVAANIGPPIWVTDAEAARNRRINKVWKAFFGLVFGVVAALWYVHSVSK